MTDYLNASIEYQEANIVSVFDEMPLWSAHFGTLLLANVPLRRDMRILDVGCGTGFPLFELAHMCGPGCEVVGVDTWEAALERARLKLSVYQPGNVQVVKLESGHYPFRDGHFDLIVSNLGINNFDDPQAVLAEWRRVGKPDARIALTTNVIGHMREFYAVYRAVLEAHGSALYLERLAANEAHRGTKESVGGLLAQAGMAVQRVVEDTLTLRYVDGSAFLRHWFIRLGFLPAWRAVVDPVDEVSVFTALEERLNMVAREQGELRLTVPMLYVEAALS